MSLRDRDKVAVLRQVEGGLLRPCEGARKLGLSSRQFRRLRRRFDAIGDAAVVHSLRGRPSNHSFDKALKEKALERAREPVFHDFGPTLLAEHLSRDSSFAALRPATLRNWMIGEGLWFVKERKLRHRSRRQRKAAYGELVQMDTSIHAWFEDRAVEQPVLIAMIDDATSRLFARFDKSDSGAANRRMLMNYIERFGRMESLYADRASHFQSRRKMRELTEGPPMSSLIKRALESLDIRLIPALSPQAKGRVERLFNTLQDRLLKELRVARISTIAAANEFLEQSFIPFWNERFTVNPQTDEDFHRSLPADIDLMELFAETHARLIRADFTIRYENVYYQIPRQLATASMPGTNITVLRRLDGTLDFKWGQKKLELIQLAGLPQSPAVIDKPHPAPKPSSRTNHPWKRSNWLFSVKD